MIFQLEQKYNLDTEKKKRCIISRTKESKKIVNTIILQIIMQILIMEIIVLNKMLYQANANNCSVKRALFVHTPILCNIKSLVGLELF